MLYDHFNTRFRQRLASVFMSSPLSVTMQGSGQCLPRLSSRQNHATSTAHPCLSATIAFLRAFIRIMMRIFVRAKAQQAFIDSTMLI